MGKLIATNSTIGGGLKSSGKGTLQGDVFSPLDSFIKTDETLSFTNGVLGVNTAKEPAEGDMRPVTADALEKVKDYFGKNGTTYVPYVSADGVISWTNDSGKPNPSPVNIKGDKGDKGEQGERGLQGIQGGKGDKGDPGTNGKDGTDGYTPQRGTDYWTDSDKAEIKSYVDQAILGGEW